jgi:hypothetical protein
VRVGIDWPPAEQAGIGDRQASPILYKLHERLRDLSCFFLERAMLFLYYICKDVKMDEALVQIAISCPLYWDMYTLLKNASSSQEEFNVIMQRARPLWLDLHY